MVKNDMDDELTRSLKSLGIPNGHIQPSISNIISLSLNMHSLLIHHRLPEKGWNANETQHLLSTFSLLDRNSSSK